MNDDAGLLQQFVREGSEPALAELARRYSGLVYASAARRLGRDAHLAGDVAQQVFLSLARRPPSLRAGQSLAPWLFTAARHKAIDQVRAERRRRTREQEALMEQRPEPTREPNWEQVRPELEAALDELGSADREAVVLRYLADHSLAEVGRALRVSEEAARKRVDRALERLRTALGKRGVASTAGALGGLLSGPGLLAAGNPELAAACVQAGVAGQSAAGAVGLVSFMSTGKLLTGLGALAVLLAASVATRETVAAFRAETALSNETAALMAATDGLHHAQRRAAVSRAAAAAPAASLADDSPAGSPDNPAAHRHSAAAMSFHFDRAKARANARGLLALNPELAKALEGIRDAAAVADYRDFLDGRKLAPEVEDRFARIMADASAGGVSVTKGGPNGPVSYDFGREAPALTAAQRDAALQQLLGPEAFQAFQDYSSQRNAWQASGLVAQDAYGANEPLTADQRTKLADAMAAYGTVKQGNLSVDWSGLSSAASEFLSPGQLQALEAASRQVQFNLAWAGGSGRVERRIMQ